MIRIAITGNIASGKSQVEKIISNLGYKVADTDKINHEILLNDIETINHIKKSFTNYNILDHNGNISREKLGKIVFNNIEKKAELERILHKRIFEKIDEFSNNNKEEKAIFISIPLLFETKSEYKFDKIIFISANEKIRLNRLIKRNNYSEEYAKKRINSQDNEENKIKKSDFVIFNNSDFNNLEKEVLNVLNKILL